MNATNECDPHLEVGILAAYLDGRLSVEEIRSVRRHIEACDECRADVVEAGGAIQQISVRRRRRLLIPAVAAAVVAGLLFVGGPLVLSSDRAPVLRGPDQSGVASADQIIATISPEAGAVVPFGELTLTWSSTASEAMYVITVTDAGGDPLWTAETRDTLALLPTTVVLLPGSTYLWYVDALLPDGQSATTGVQRFQTAP